MFSNFLKRNERSKLQILARVIKEPYLAVEYLAESLDYTERTINRQIHELNQDLKAVFCMDFSIKTVSRNLYFHGSKQDCPAECVTKKMYLYYLNQSLLFQLFQQIFIQKNQNILSISYQMNVSQSHCYQLIKLMNEQLHPYELELSLQNFMIALQGPEIKQTYFLLCITDAYYKLNDQSAGKELKNTKKDPFIEHPRVFEQNSFSLFTAIFEQQEKHLAEIQINQPAITELLAGILKKNHYFKPESFPTNVSAMAYNLFLRLFIPSIDNGDLRRTLGAEFLAKKDNPIVKSFLQVTDRLDLFFSAHPDLGFYLPNKEELCYLFVIHTSYIGLIEKDLMSLLKEDFSQIFLAYSSHSVSKITHFIERILRENAQIFPEWPQATCDVWTDHLTKLTCSIILPLSQPKIRIFIQAFSCFSDEYALKNQILNYFSPKLIEYVENYEEADLVISDQEISNTLAIPHIFIFDHYSNTLWIHVLQRIVSESHKKIVRYVDTYMAEIE